MKLKKEDVEKKIKHHKNRLKFYTDKLKDIESDSKKIGFKY